MCIGRTEDVCDLGLPIIQDEKALGAEPVNSNY